MKSLNEEFCKSKFDDFLKKVQASASIVCGVWQDGDEPPDFYFTLDDIRYAVEITILTEKIAVGTFKMPRVAIAHSLWKFVDEVEQLARERHLLHGAYIVRFSKAIEDFSAVKDDIRIRLLGYIECTQAMEKSPGKTVFKRRRQSCIIEKLHTRSDRIHKAGPHNTKWGGEAETEICDLVEERLADKCYKLRNLALPKIALLYDSYHFAGSKMYKDCVYKLPSLSSFHTVFIVQSDSDGFILYSENLGWS